MSLESDIFDTLKSLVSNRCYPDAAPSEATAPYIKWQQVGGTAINLLEAAAPGKRNARIQVASWASTRVASSALARSAENALIVSALKAYVLGALTATFDKETGLYGSLQDFSIYY